MKRFGLFELDAATGELRKNGGRVRLTPQAFRILCELLERPGELVARDALKRALWPDEPAYRSDENLSRAVKRLRQAIGDPAANPRFIETLRDRGYRFIAPVTTAERPAQDTARRPYPGLAFFSESDVARFFGREKETELLSERVTRLPLAALIGPSGAGKTSLVRAGLLPSLASSGWRSLVLHPGDAPFRALGRALAPEVTSDTDLVQELVRFDEPGVAFSVLEKWSRAHENTLLVVDQFEELFSHDTESVRDAFTQLLARASREAGIHVLLSLRDDFLMRCQRYAALAEVFRELTPLGPPSPESLRRALVEPARALGFAFEDELLVDQMINEVALERGALPLLAFAAGRLWEERDAATKRLTRRGLESIGGVSGAMAHHAESTLARLGPERIEHVRNVFRALTTARSTRIARTRSELVTLFDDREAADRVLDELVDARLLTSFDEESIEIIHESLLDHWPRLVRWRTRDADGALLRDQLRQASSLWDERRRPEDLLWAGRSVRELALWREDYRGALTEAEKAFVASSLEVAERRSRRSRYAAIAAIVVLLLLVVFIGLTARRTEIARQRAEASRVLTLARFELDRNPTGAVAFALKSLELADGPAARRFALRALQRAPTARVLKARRHGAVNVAFSHDGRALVVSGAVSDVDLYRRDGSDPVTLAGHRTSGIVEVRFDASTGLLVTEDTDSLRFWSPLDGALVRTSPRAPRPTPFDFMVSDGSASWLVRAEGTDLYRAAIDGGAPGAEERFASHSAEILMMTPHPDGERFATLDALGAIRLWSMRGGAASLHVATWNAAAAGRANDFVFDPRGSKLAASSDLERPRVLIWDLEAPPGAEPVVLERGGPTGRVHGLAFDPEGLWLASAHSVDVGLWRLDAGYERTLRGHTAPIEGMAFTPDGTRLVSSSMDGTVRTWPVSHGGEPARILFEGRLAYAPLLDMDPEGKFVVVGSRRGVFIVPLDGREPRELTGFDEAGTFVVPVAAGPGGLVAAASFVGPGEEKLIRIWDSSTGKPRVLGPLPSAGEGNDGGFKAIRFTPEGDLLSVGTDGWVRLWTLANGRHRVLRNVTEVAGFAELSPDGTKLLVPTPTQPYLLDLRSMSEHTLTTHKSRVEAAFGPDGDTIVTVTDDGVLRVGPASGAEPHLLFPKDDIVVRRVAVSPDGNLVAVAADDGSIRLWTMPKGKPFHVLPLAQILEHLRMATNVRAIEDATSPTGYRLEVGSFAGWT